MTRRPAALWLFAVSSIVSAQPPDLPPPAGTPEPAPATSVQPPPSRRVMWSRTQRFAAIGANPGELIELLIWAEDFADRLAQFVGNPLPTHRAAPLEFHIAEDPSLLEGQVRIREFEDLGGWSQRILITNSAATDPADVLDAFSLLLLSRYAQALQTPDHRRARPARVAGWWAAGVARQLLPGARALGRREVLREWDAGRCLSLVRLLTPRPPGPGAALEKAYAAAAVAWLKSRRDFPEIMEGLFRRWAAGDADDAAFLAERLGFPGNERALEIEWELWLAALRARQSQFAPATAGDLRALRDTLILRRADLPPGAPDTLPARLPLELLAQHRAEPWARAAARRLHGSVVRLQYGRGAEFRAVVVEYAGYLAAVARSDPASRSAFARWAEGRVLHRRLAAAASAQARLEARVLARPAPAASENLPSDGPNRADLEQRALLEIQRDAARDSPRSAGAP